MSEFSDITISTRGIKCAGIKKCKPKKRLCWFNPSAIDEIPNVDELLVITVPSFARETICLNMFCLTARSSTTFSITRSVEDQSTDIKSDTNCKSKLSSVTSKSRAALVALSLKVSARPPGRPTTVTRAPDLDKLTARSVPIVPAPTITIWLIFNGLPI